MKNHKRARLEAAGWKVGSASEFLGLTAQEAALVEMKLSLADHLRRRRTESGWTQAQMARRLGTSQSRLAKMEAADASVSIDLYVRGLLSAGADRRELGRIIGTPFRKRAA